jgi:hypothetical protein
MHTQAADRKVMHENAVVIIIIMPNNVHNHNESISSPGPLVMRGCDQPMATQVLVLRKT